MSTPQILNNGDSLLDIRTKINDNFTLVKDSFVKIPYGSSISVEQRHEGKLYLFQLSEEDITSFRIEDYQGNIITPQTTADNVLFDTTSTGSEKTNLQEILDEIYAPAVESKLPPFAINAGNVDVNGNADILYYGAGGTVEENWVQPNISSNGTLGVDDFACSLTTSSGATTTVFRMFDGNSNTSFSSSELITRVVVYIKGGIKCTGFSFSATPANARLTNVKIYGGTTSTFSQATLLHTLPAPLSATTSTTFTNNNVYEYYWFEYENSRYATTPVSMVQLDLVGTKVVTTAPTKINYRGAITATTGDKTQFILYNIQETDISSLPNGIYNVFIGADDTKDILNAPIHTQELPPLGSIGAVWFKNLAPTGAFQWDGESWVKYDKVPIGTVTVNNGSITEVTTFPFNYTQFNGMIATTQTFGLLRVSSPEDEIDCNCTDATITPKSLYDINELRKANTSYSLGDSVACAYHHNLYLYCVKAGTTSNEALNTSGELTVGQQITDGAVTWKVGTSLSTITYEVYGEIEIKYPEG